MKVEKESSTDNAVCCDSEEEGKYPCTYFYDLPLASMKGLSVGDEIVVILKGTVKALTQREDYDDKEKVNGNLDMYYSDITIKSGKKSEWEDMVEE